ncbi:MAG: trigger factor [Steroidobacteraceae bacterium]
MQVSVTATGGLERRLEVAVPAAQVSDQVEARLKRLARTARIKGFRPGKAPLAIIRQQYGAQVHSEVIDDLVRTSLNEALDKENLRPAAGPRIEPKSMSPGSDLEYVATFEVLPDVTLAPAEDLAIARPSASITDQDITDMVENLRSQRPVFTEVARNAAGNDRVTVDYHGTIDGQPFKGSEASDVPFVLGTGRLLKELEDAVQGAAAGERREASVQYPDDYSNQDVAGKSAHFTITVKKVEEQSLPPLDEAFCKAFGVADGNIEALRTEVRQSMERELAQAIRNRLRAAVMDALVAANPIELPTSMVEQSIQDLQIDMARRLNIRDAAQLPGREPFVEPARRRVALGLILGEIIRRENLAAAPQRVAARIEEIASAYPEPQQVRKFYADNREAMRQVESSVLEEQVIDWLVERARISDQPASFRELTGFGRTEENA